jgi:hypothetical protein
MQKIGEAMNQTAANEPAPQAGSETDGPVRDADVKTEDTK